MTDVDLVEPIGELSNDIEGKLDSRKGGQLDGQGLRAAFNLDLAKDEDEGYVTPQPK